MKTALVVLGMHRSGTSALTGALTLLGATAPQSLMKAGFDNERGYFESSAIMALNDAILESAGSFWNDWRGFNPRWRETRTASDFADRALAVLDAEFAGASLIALKDPRTCRFADFWFSVLQRGGYDCRVLIPVRNPIEVAASLHTRDGMPAPLGLLVWLRHVLEAEHSSRGVQRHILMWADLLNDWRHVLDDCERALGLAWPRRSDFVDQELAEFLSPGMRHHEADDRLLERSDVNRWVRDAFEALRTLSRGPDPAAQAILDEIRREFGETATFYGPAFTALELQARETSARRADQPALDALKNQVLQIEGHAKGLSLLLDQARTARAEAEAETAALKATVVELQGELKAKSAAAARPPT